MIILLEIFNMNNTNDFPSNNTAAYLRLVESMKRAKQNKRPFCLFIGAGCSLTSSEHSVTTEQVIKDCLEQCMGPDYIFSKSWEVLYKDFVNYVWDVYAAEDKQEILYERFKNMSPSIGYRMLKELVVNGYIQYIITTNFDMLLDDVLLDVPHNVQVSDLPERKIKGGSNISIIKVHGDVENGNLRFSPKELLELPNDISEKITSFSKYNCLVCGYRGQDEGVMKSLNKESKLSSFWSSPHLPLSSDKYETEKIFSWMKNRDSENNFIYGDQLGTFDELMTQLAYSLLGRETNDILPNYWSKNIITQSLEMNKKAINIFTNILSCSNELYKKYKWEKKYPFYAEKYETVLDAYLFFYKCNIENIPSPLKIPENEIEALLVGISIEIMARISGINESPVKYAKFLKATYNKKNYELKPNDCFWDGLFIILSSIQNTNEKPDWNSIHSIGLNLNNNGRLSIIIKEPMLQKISNVINILNLCSMLCPTCKNIENNDIRQRTKILLEKYALPISSDESHIILSFDNMTKDEYNQIYSLFLEKQPSIIAKNTIVVSPTFNSSDKKHCIRNDTLYEYIVTKSKKLSNDYLELKTVFEYDKEVYVETGTEELINDFINTSYVGLFLIGTSGSGKTKTIQHFIKSLNDNYIIAATAPKCGILNESYGISAFFNDIFYDANKTEINLQNFNDSLIAHHKTLILIFDGINEMSSGFADCLKQYKELIALINQIYSLRLSNIKVIVSCRDYAFLDYCETTGVFPSTECCYGYFKNSKYIPYFQIPPLGLETQIDFCKAYINDKNRCEWFIANLKTNKYFRDNFTHPYLIAIAGKHCNNTTHDFNFINIIFMKFTDEMLNRLSKSDDKFLAQDIINEYCSLLISSDSYSSITTYLLLGSNRFAHNRIEAHRVLKELKDINLFASNNTSDNIRISHDRIEEYLLFRYLYFGQNPIEKISSTIKLLTIDSVYSCAVQQCINKCFFDEKYHLILNNILNWYDINPHILPLMMAKSLCELNMEKCINLFNIIVIIPACNNIMKIIVLGIKQLISQNHVQFPITVINAFDLIAKTFSQYNNYLAELYYIASKYYYETKNDFEKAMEYCENALKLCNKESNIYNVVQLQISILRSEDINNDNLLIKYNELFEYFKSRNSWEYAAECALHWGSLLRKKTKFEKAIEIYNLIEQSNIESNLLLRASIERKIGTANKNIMQRLIREKNCEIEKINLYYSNAMQSFSNAKKLLSNTYDLEMLSLISEMTETAILVTPYIPSQHYFADLYISEEEKMLSYIPIPECEILHIRNKARLLALDGQYETAVDILIAAKDIAKDRSLAFRMFEVNYQICRLISKQWDDVCKDKHKIGLIALNEALQYNLDSDNEYYQALLKTKKTYDIKMKAF